MEDQNRLNELAQRIVSSKKYRDLSPDTIVDVLSIELKNHKTEKAAVEAARKKLHKILAAYLGFPDFKVACRTLKEAFKSADDKAVSDVCAAIMRTHISARERLDMLSELYAAIFQITGAPARVMDLACALNPFSFRWMNLSSDATYIGYDNNRNFVDLANYYFKLEGVKNRVEFRDIACDPPNEFTDVAFLTKMYPCLEIRRKGAGLHILEHIPARWVAASFPKRNIRSMPVDILGNYEADIRRMCAEKGWNITELDFDTEVFLLVRKVTTRVAKARLR